MLQSPVVPYHQIVRLPFMSIPIGRRSKLIRVDLRKYGIALFVIHSNDMASRVTCEAMLVR
jgi:hypothetical protein